jgi:acyl dehydratase
MRMTNPKAGTMSETTTQAPAEPKDIGGKITQEDIDRCRAQIGVPRYEHNPPYNLEVTKDAIRHFAFSCGEDNPLWNDPAYGAKTRWGDQLAPPMFFVTTGIGLAPKLDEAGKRLFRGLFKGVSKYYSGVEWTWWRPLHPVSVVYEEHTTSDVVVREQSSFSGGLTVTEVYRHLYVDEAGQPLAMREESFVNAERSGSRKAGKYNDVKRQTYTPEDIARIDAVYAAEQLRGAQARYWEDVQVGDDVTPVAKGPFSMVEVIAYHMGQGLSHYGIGPLRLNWKQRQRMPGFYVEDRYGVPDVSQRVHWDQDRAQELGLPTSHDYGQMRANWLAHLVTNWMGDDGWLWKLSLQTRAFNFMGDTTICSGVVADKRIEDGHHVVELTLQSVNQRGENTAPGKAIVILPTREAEAHLPEPPADVAARGKAMTATMPGR